MKVLFHHEPFDVDVSSGTIHALYQWFELFHAFGVTECAIVNTSGDDIPLIDSNMTVSEYSTLDEFMSDQKCRKIMVDTGGKSHRNYKFPNSGWLVFGGTGGLPKANVGIDTCNGTALYPREAAAIILGSL